MAISTERGEFFADYGGGFVWIQLQSEAATSWHELGYIEKVSVRPNISPTKKKDSNGVEFTIGISRSAEAKFTLMQMDYPTLQLENEVRGKKCRILILLNPDGSTTSGFDDEFVWCFIPQARYEGGGGFEFQGGTSEYTFGLDLVSSASISLSGQTLPNVPSGVTLTGSITFSNHMYGYGHYAAV